MRRTSSSFTSSIPFLHRGIDNWLWGNNPVNHQPDLSSRRFPPWLIFLRDIWMQRHPGTGRDSDPAAQKDLPETSLRNIPLGGACKIYTRTISRLDERDSFNNLHH